MWLWGRVRQFPSGGACGGRHTPHVRRHTTRIPPPLSAALRAQVILITSWGLTATATIDPWDLGVAMLTVWPAVLLTILAGLTWRAKGWHMRPLTRSPSSWIGSVQSLFITAAALIVIWCAWRCGVVGFGVPWRVVVECRCRGGGMHGGVRAPPLLRAM